MPESIESRLTAWAWRLTVLVALFGGLGLALAASQVGTDARFHVSSDVMAFEGHAWLLHQGRISGRDFSAAWGPLSQILASLAVALRSEGDYAGSGPMIYFLFRAAGVLGLVAWVALLPLRRWWQVFLPLAAFGWVLAASSHAVFRVAAGLLAMRAAASALAARPGRDWRGIVLAAVVLIVAGLASIDMLAFGAASLVVGALCLALFSQVECSRRVLNRTGAILLLSVGGGAALLLIARLTAADRTQALLKPLHRVVERAATYPQVFGLPWSIGTGATLAWLLILIFAIFAGWKAAQVKEDPLRFDFALLAPFALFSLKSSLTRSDSGHIGFGLMALLAVLSLLPASRFRRPGERFSQIAVLACGLAIWPTGTIWSHPPGEQALRPRESWRNLRERIPSEERFPTGLLSIASRKAGPLFVFPLQIGFAAIANRHLVAPVDQIYGAHTIEMQEQVVGELKSSGPRLGVVYGLDDLPTWRVDQVQSITRSPVVAEFLLQEFERDPPALLDGGFLYLVRRARPRQMNWGELAFSILEEPSGLVVQLRESVGCAVFRVQLELSYSLLYRMSWSGALWAQAGRLGEPKVFRTRLVPLEVGRPFWTMMSPLRGEEFGSLFDNGTLPHAPSIERIHLQKERVGLFGVQPKRVRIHRLQCLESLDIVD